MFAGSATFSRSDSIIAVHLFKNMILADDAVWQTEVVRRLPIRNCIGPKHMQLLKAEFSLPTGRLNNIPPLFRQSEV